MAISFLSSDPELEFVVRASGPTPAGPDDTNVRDWGRVVALAVHHRVYPRVWQRAASSFPEPFRGALSQHVQTNARAALQNLAATIDTIALLRDAGVEPIVLKGPLQARLLYGDYALRVAGDIDLLVPAAQLQQAGGALSGAGFRHHTPLSTDALKRHQKTEHDIAFVHPATGLLVELHVDIAQPLYGYRVDLAHWRQSVERHTVGNVSLTVLSPEHGYLLCALHAAKHRWHRLDLVADIAAYMALGQNARSSTDRHLQTWMSALVTVGEELAAGFYGAGRIQTKVVQEVALKVMAGSEFGRWGGIWLDVRLRDRRTEQGRYLLNRCLPPLLRL
jgi:hypothetical protein